MSDAVAQQHETSDAAWSIRVLCVDDEPAVVDLTSTFLERQGFDTLTATSGSEALEILDREVPDCVVSDYQMPGMDGLDLLDAVRRAHPDLPFILFTGQGSEEIASEAISRGVTDYLQKETGSDQYEVLTNRVRNAVDRYRAEARLETFLESVPDGLVVVDRDGTITQVNSRLGELFGYEPDELVGEPIELLVPERDRESHVEERDAYAESPSQRPMGSGRDLAGRRKDGTEFPVDVSLSPVEIRGRQEVLATVRDRSKHEDGIRGLSEGTVDALPTGVLVRAASGEVVHANERFADLLDVDVSTLVGRVPDLSDWDPRDETGEVDVTDLPFDTVLETGETVTDWQVSVRTPADRRVWLRVHAAPLRDGGDVSHVVYAVEDVTDLRNAEAERADRLDRITDGFTTVDEEWRITYANRQAAAFLDRDREALLGSVLWDEFPEAVETAFYDAYTDAMETGEPRTVEAYYEPLDTWFESRVYPSDTGLSLYFRDVSDQVEREFELERYETIVETIQDGVYTLDAEGRFTFANEAMVDMSRFDDADDLLGEHISVMLGSEEVGLGQSQIERLLKEDVDAVSFEMDLENHAGELVPYEIKLSLLPSADGEFRGTVGIVRDISERRERQRRYEAIFNHTFQFTGLLEPDGTLVEANETALEFGGIDREDVVGKKIWETEWFQISPRTKRQVREDIARAAQGEFVRHELDVRGADRVATIDFSIKPVTDEEGEVVLMVPEGRDITALKERERELERQNERLEEFASIVSHDLRNPLTVAKGYLDLARTSGDAADFDRVEAAHDRMERLIDDLLRLARNGRQVEETATVDLATVAEEAWATVDSDSATLSVTLAGHAVEADPERLRSLLENLYQNAVKHGGSGVTIEVGSLDDGGFYVADDGPGIPEADRESVFERGYSTEQEGTGFGLAIVESIVAAHGWEISATESDAGGARFEVRYDQSADGTPPSA